MLSRPLAGELAEPQFVAVLQVVPRERRVREVVDEAIGENPRELRSQGLQSSE